MSRISQILIPIENLSRYPNMEGRVRTAIDLIGTDRFKEVSKIRLLDFIDSGRKLSNVPMDVEDALSNGFSIPCLYFVSENTIELYLGEIFRGIPPPLLKTQITAIRLVNPLARTLCYALLSLRRTQLPEHREQRLANRYVRYVVCGLKRKFKFRFWSFIIREIASWHYNFGLADWRRGDLERAESDFYTAWLLDPENGNANEHYWTVRSLRLGVDENESDTIINGAGLGI